MTEKLPISVLILTKNEEQDLPGCLDSLTWSDDVLIIDSQSTDATAAIAAQYQARFVIRAFDGYASQRNFGLQQSFKYDWILIVDADERVTESLRAGMGEFIRRVPADVAAGRLQRRDIWWGRWLKHAQITPLYIRLIRKGKAFYEREINEVLKVEGEVGDISGHLDHYPFSKGLSHWIDKHSRYASMEADVIVNNQLGSYRWSKALWGDSLAERRANQKAIFIRLPLRPVIKFFYMFFWRRAFLDGVQGFRYCMLQCIYEYFIALYVVEKNVKQ